MSRTSALILIGTLTILIPFSGLPIALRTLLTVVCGIAVLTIGLVMRSHEVHKSQSAEMPSAEPVMPTPPTSPSSI